ncbi:hypothetical protein [Methylobacterium sp. A54F]
MIEQPEIPSVEERRAALFRALAEGDARRRRERKLRDQLRRWGMRLREQRSGYVVFDRDTFLSELHGATLDAVEDWVASRLAARSARS